VDEHETSPATTRDRILAITRRLIAERGPDGFRLRDVAEELGYTTPSLYRHFSGRRELILEALRLEIADTLGRAGGLDSHQDEASDRLSRLLDEHAAYLLSSDAGTDRFLLRSALDAAAHPELQGEVSAIIAEVMAVVRSAVDKSTSDSAGLSPDATLVIATMTGLQFLGTIDTIEMPDPRSVYERLLHVLADDPT